MLDENTKQIVACNLTLAWGTTAAVETMQTNQQVDANEIFAAHERFLALLEEREDKKASTSQSSIHVA